MSNFVQTETLAGEPYKFGDTKITPYSKSLKLLVPGFLGGLIWNRPDSILVQKPDGSEQIIPVIDVTRQVIWAIFGASLLSVILMFSLSNKKRN